jgi:hypothetical protein
MSELERELTELGRALEFPATPDLVPVVRRRLAEQRPRRVPVLSRRTLAVALAALAVAIGIALAVPPARSAILRIFGVGGVRIERVDRLPEVAVARRLDLGDEVSLDHARRVTGFRIRVPTVDGFDEPDAIYVSDGVPGGLVSFLYGSETRPRALLSEFETEPGLPYIRKSAPRGTRIEAVTVDGGRGYWLEGAPHEFVFVNRNGQTQPGTLRLATNTLVWQRDRLTLRLEGKLTRSEALRIARSMDG